MRRNLWGVALSVFLAAFVIAASQTVAVAQSGDQSTRASVAVMKEDETNLDTQLYLIVGTNQSVQDSNIPAGLDQIVKQLRASLPFKNYSVTATLLNRVKHGGHLNLRWVGGPLLAPAASSASTPSINEFGVGRVRVFTDETGRTRVHMDAFHFGSRIPIQTQTIVASAAASSGPIVSYEPMGLNTDVGMREGEPVIVGTLNVGPSGDALVLVVSAKRAPR